MDQVGCVSKGKGHHWSDKTSNGHRVKRWYKKQISSTDQSYVLAQKEQLFERMKDLQYSVFLEKWEKHWQEEGWIEPHKIAERLARKTGLALRFMSVALGFVIGMFAYGAYSATTHRYLSVYCNFPLLLSNTSVKPNPGAPTQFLCPIGTLHSRLSKDESEDIEKTQNDKNLKSTNDYVEINGHITGFPHYLNGLPETKVLVIDPETNDRIDSTFTDALGNYLLSFYWTGLKNPQAIEIFDDEFTLYPNPNSGNTSLSVDCSIDQSFHLSIFDMAGKQVLNEELAMQKGVNRVTLSGGAPGVYLITLSNGQMTKVAKSVNISSSNKAYNATVTNIGDFFKDGIVDGTLVRLEFTKDGYNLKDTTFVVALENTINVQMDMIPLTYNFNVSAISVATGDKVIDGTALKVTWGDGTNNTYSSLDGIININRETYDTIKNIFIENADTTFYQEWIFGLKKDPQITTKEVNLFQSQKESSGQVGTPYVHPTPAPANLNLLPGEFDVIFVPNLVQDSQGLTYHTTSELFRTVIHCRSPPTDTKRWEYVPEVGNVVYLYEMQMKFNNGYPGEPLTFEQSELQRIAMDSVETQLFKLGNRDLMPPYERVNIYDFTEQEWLEGSSATRDFDQTHFINYDGLNNNTASFTLNYTMSPKYRFKHGTANYTLSSNMGYKITEMLQSFTHWRDPEGSNLGGFVVNATGTLTSFGKTARIVYIANPGTIFW